MAPPMLLIHHHRCIAFATPSLPRFASPPPPLSRTTLHFPRVLPPHPLLRSSFLVSAGLSSSLRGEKRVESDSLPAQVRQQTMKAVDELGWRVTVGDVASRAGLKVTQAETALQALATDTGGFLEVSADGDVLYVFPTDYRSVLLANSIKLKLEPLFNRLKAVANYLIRVSFGTTLLASIVLVYSTIVVLLTSSRSDEGDRRRDRSYNSGFSIYISPADLFWYWDPYYYRRRTVVANNQRDRGGLNFFESVFSFVFGDGDPNEGKEVSRWQRIGEYIKSKGGVVCAEELAPFLDVPLFEESQDVESLMLPVLLRFDGEPEVDKLGNIVYRFPSLQRTASRWAMTTDQEPFAENQWIFSKATEMNKFLVVGLGVINLIGVIILSGWLRDASVLGRFSDGLVPFMARILPVLQVYSAAFFAIPGIRWFFLQKKNSEIVKRNHARKQWRKLLEQPDFNLQKKLKSTRNLAKQTVIGREEIIYSTEKDISDQNFEVQDWERRFNEKGPR